MKLLTLFVLPLLLLSCSSVHKTYSKNQTSSDSSAVTHAENMSSAKHDSTVSKESADTWTRETVIEFDTIGLAPVDIPVKNVHDNSNRLIAWVYQKPTKITIKETGTSQVKQSGVYTNKDTSYAMADANTHVKDTSKVISKDKTSSRIPIGFWISFALAAAITIAAFWLTKKVKKAGDIAQDVADVANGLSNKA